jgi:hypothetical protein
MGTTTRDGHAVTFGLSALIPMILTDIKRQTYDRKNWWYGQLASQDPAGRVAVGYDPAAHHLAVIVQDDSTAEYTLENLRDFADEIGCAHAVGLDGSTSAMLRCATQTPDPWVVRNTSSMDYKNRFNGNAVAFYYD